MVRGCGDGEVCGTVVGISRSICRRIDNVVDNTAAVACVDGNRNVSFLDLEEGVANHFAGNTRFFDVRGFIAFIAPTPEIVVAIVEVVDFLR